MPRQTDEPILDNNRAGGEYTEYTQITFGEDRQGGQKAHFHNKGEGSLDVTESPDGLTHIRVQGGGITDSATIPTASISTVATNDEIVGVVLDLEKVCNTAGAKFKGPATPKEQRPSYETLRSENRLTVSPAQKTGIDTANSLSSRKATPTNQTTSPFPGHSPVPGHFNEM